MGSSPSFGAHGPDLRVGYVLCRQYIGVQMEN